MTPNENFKNALKTGNLADALVIALSKATELKITTFLVSANDYYGKNSHLHPEDCLETKVNLLRGEIENKIGENLLKNELYENLQKLHLEEALESSKLIQNNLESLQKLFTILADLREQQLKIKNPEVVSLHLGNQLPPPPPPNITYTPPLKRESLTNQNSAVIVTEIESLTPKKSEYKKSNQHQQYDWKTLAESMVESEIIQDEDQTINIRTQDETEEDWGDLIMEEESNLKKSPVKEKNINTDRTVVSNQEINNLITEQNLYYENNPEKQPDHQIIEHLSIEEDQINSDTKVISETEINAFLAEEENKRILSELNQDNFSINNQETKSISENEINEMLSNEDWGDLLEDNDEELDTEEIEDDLTADFSSKDSDDDWDEVIEELYEPKIPSQNKDEK